MRTHPRILNSAEQQAIENVSQELQRLYRQAVGKEADPAVVWAEAEDFVAKYGPNADPAEWF